MQGNTPLLLAIHYSRKIVDVLLSGPSANINATDKEVCDMTLNTACTVCQSEAHLMLLILLVKSCSTSCYQTTCALQVLTVMLAVCKDDTLAMSLIILSCVGCL